jgi:hypothetical protein
MKPKKIIIDENGNRMVFCSQHKEYTPIEEFGLQPSSNYPRSACKRCEAKASSKRRSPDYVKVRKSDREVALEILAELGYNVNSEVPLWIQFMMRHEMIGSKFTDTSRSIIESQRLS